MISGRDLHTMQTSGKYPCAVCRKGAPKKTQSSVVDVRFGFTKSVPISQVDQLKILILGVEGVLVMHGQLIDLMLNSNLLIEKLMQLTTLSILVTAFVQVKAVSLPLLRDVALHGEHLENSYPCLLLEQFLLTHVVKCITAVSDGRCFIHQNLTSELTS